MEICRILILESYCRITFAIWVCYEGCVYGEIYAIHIVLVETGMRVARASIDIG